MTDAYAGNNSLLLRCDGANDSTTFTDSSQHILVPTVVDNAKITTASYAPLMGNAASAVFAGDGAATFDNLSYPSSQFFGLGLGDYTLEAWCNPTSLTGSRRIFNLVSAGTEAQISVAAGGLGYYVYRGGVVVNELAGTISTATWQHIAVVRYGSAIYGFVGGVLVFTAADSGDYGASANLHIGSDNAGINNFNGYLDDIRITKDVARYIAGFTPPTDPFDNFMFLPPGVTRPVSAQSQSQQMGTPNFLFLA